jgi:hypothetical protein
MSRPTASLVSFETMRTSPLAMGAAVVGAALAVSACTSSGADPTPTLTQTVTSTRTPSPSSIGPTAPVVAGPTTTAAATACPLLAQQTAASQVGMRLDRITVQRSGGKVVGCRFYALEHPNAQCDATCLANEHLPPGNQAVIEIVTTRYPSVIAAHNAFVISTHGGSNPQQVTVSVDNTGVCFQIPFYSKDHGTDWACAFSVDKTAVVVKTVASESLNVVAVAREIARKV